MGLETGSTEFECGCIQYYEYNEYCGMGPVAGSQRYYWKRCESHEREIGVLTHIMAVAKQELDEIDKRIKSNIKK